MYVLFNSTAATYRAMHMHAFNLTTTCTQIYFIHADLTI